MIRTALILATVVLACTAALADQPGDQTKDQAIVKSTSQSYVDAFNRGDAAAIAQLWAPDGEYVAPEGDSIQGQAAITAMYEALFKEAKGITLKVTPTDMRFEGPDKAVERGTAVVTRPGTEPQETHYILTQVKRDGQWKVSRVSEAVDTTVVSVYEHLKELEWLIGQWVDKDEQADIETTNEWTENKCFISSSFTAKPANGIGFSGTMVIGWDPVDQVIKSWVFDSRGAFGQGVWKRDGNQWTVTMATTLSTGEQATAVNTYKYVDNNTFVWSSTSREIDGEPLPSIAEVTIVRKTAAASASGAAQ
jgi:uncharacterized protein (TIGR02246 family)